MPENRAQYWYVLAKMYAERGDCERCVHCLRKAHEEGYRKLHDINKDPEFSSVRNGPRVVELLASKRPQGFTVSQMCTRLGR